jgi:hypothetical protein
VTSTFADEGQPLGEAGGTFAPMPNETSRRLNDTFRADGTERGSTPWGQKEICAYTEKSEVTVRQWIHYKPSTEARPPFPEATWTVGGGKAWAEAVLLAYWVRWGYTSREPMPAGKRRQAMTKLRRWGISWEDS